uniref:FAD/NAD(P)-binding domain-containing protein n=1 Tax=Clastoptera arizonana TaxID=38151 RepID=A0A1B6CC86_9HEMI
MIINNIIKTDALIIGAGPVGLFQVFELGLLDIKCCVVDSLSKIGGQCIELYPDKPIYDIPAIPSCTGKELINNLLKQIEPFKPNFYLNQEIKKIKKKDNLFYVKSSKNKFICKTIFIAAGVGAFKHRKLKIKNINKFNNLQLFYKIKNINIFKNKNIIICGGGDSALD